MPAVAELKPSFNTYFALASLLFIAAPRLRAPIDLVLGIGVGCLVEALARLSAPSAAPRPASRRPPWTPSSP